MSSSPRVLLLGSIPRIMLAVARSLGRHDIQVDLACEWPENIVSKSRYVKSTSLIPRYDPCTTDWLEAISAAQEKRKYQLVIPCGDWENLLCHRHREVLTPEVPIAMASQEALDVLIDKRSGSLLAKAAGVTVPDETLVNCSTTYLPEGFRYPLVLKPRLSFGLERPGQWQRVVKVRSDEELISKLSRLDNDEIMVAQNNFEGTGVGVELLLLDGVPLMSFQHVRVHQPIDGGPSSYRKSDRLSPELLEASEKILRPLRYTGVAMVEFILAENCKNYVFLEINPRFWGSLALPVAAGIDFPYALYQMQVHGRTRFKHSYRANVYARNWSLEIAWLIERRPRVSRAWRCISSFAQFLVNLILLREHSDTFTLDDPRPALAELRVIASELNLTKWLRRG